ncbi:MULTISPECIES: conjugal transfer protein [Actinomadura]|uniref:conjugal transfer protein n=1 Tax=Actinomadura TaxID=1988 RepID=UPI00055241A9|nr:MULTISPECIES: conjugal transfer protein [Actinomadura]RSN48403.1 conjugal transfer protein [Actinomadura sp. WAC 06369]
MARRSAVKRGRDTAVVDETAAPGLSVDPWEVPDDRGRGGPRGGRWSGSGGRWWVWTGRAVLWALIIVILVNGIRAPFERFTAADAPDTAAAPKSSPERAQFPTSAAGAFALQFANVYLNYDQENAADRQTQLRTFLPEGADPQFGWNGTGTLQVQSVQVAGVQARDARNATVTLLARTGDKWLRLAVPVYANESGALVVAARPALLPPPAKAALPQQEAAPRDTPLEGELQPILVTFFQAYARSDTTALSRFAAGSPISGLARSVEFLRVAEVVAPQGSAGARTVTASVVWRVAGGELEQAYELDMVRKDATWYVKDIRGTTDPDPS